MSQGKWYMVHGILHRVYVTCHRVNGTWYTAQGICHRVTGTWYKGLCKEYMAQGTRWRDIHYWG
jgi:hypothetical protein